MAFNYEMRLVYPDRHDEYGRAREPFWIAHPTRLGFIAAVKRLQTLVGTFAVDGIIGPETVKLVGRSGVPVVPLMFDERAAVEWLADNVMLVLNYIQTMRPGQEYHWGRWAKS